jgi:hypothetical protein
MLSFITGFHKRGIVTADETLHCIFEPLQKTPTFDASMSTQSTVAPSICRPKVIHKAFTGGAFWFIRLAVLPDIPLKTKWKVFQL